MAIRLIITLILCVASTLLVLGCDEAIIKHTKEQKCEAWWEEASRPQSTTTIQCVHLIRQHCPQLMDVQIVSESKMPRTLDVSVVREIEAIHRVTGERIYYDKKTTQALCWDNDVDCSLWWNTMYSLTVSDDMKQKCLINIYKHCQSTKKEVTLDSRTKPNERMTKVFRKHGLQTTATGRRDAILNTPLHERGISSTSVIREPKESLQETGALTKEHGESYSIVPNLPDNQHYPKRNEHTASTVNTQLSYVQDHSSHVEQKFINTGTHHESHTSHVSSHFQKGQSYLPNSSDESYLPDASEQSSVHDSTGSLKPRKIKVEDPEDTIRNQQVDSMMTPTHTSDAHDSHGGFRQPEETTANNLGHTSHQPGIEEQNIENPTSGHEPLPESNEHSDAYASAKSTPTRHDHHSHGLSSPEDKEEVEDHNIHHSSTGHEPVTESNEHAHESSSAESTPTRHVEHSHRPSSYEDRQEVENQCDQQWKEAYKKYMEGFDPKPTINIIATDCPEMLEVHEYPTKTVMKDFVSVIVSKAVTNKHTKENMFISEAKREELCSDKSVDCNIWSRITHHVDIPTEIKEVCAILIYKYCMPVLTTKSLTGNK